MSSSAVSKIIAMLPASGGCGTTTVAINMAKALATMGKVVALVDASIEYPNDYRYFGLKEMDLNKSLIEKISSRSFSIEDLIYQTNDKNIKLVCNNPLELIGNPVQMSLANCKDMFNALSMNFDFVVVDCDCNMYNELTYTAVSEANSIYTVMSTKPQLFMNIAKKQKFVSEVSGRDSIKSVIVNKVFEQEIPEDFIESLGLSLVGAIRMSGKIEKDGVIGKSSVASNDGGDKGVHDLKHVINTIIEEVC